MLLKHFSNIDVNKADNEGNSPLHFIAQAGYFFLKISDYVVYMPLGAHGGGPL